MKITIFNQHTNLFKPILHFKKCLLINWIRTENLFFFEGVSLGKGVAFPVIYNYLRATDKYLFEDAVPHFCTAIYYSIKFL